MSSGWDGVSEMMPGNFCPLGQKEKLSGMPDRLPGTLTVTLFPPQFPNFFADEKISGQSQKLSGKTVNVSAEFTRQAVFRCFGCPSRDCPGSPSVQVGNAAPLLVLGLSGRLFVGIIIIFVAMTKTILYLPKCLNIIFALVCGLPLRHPGRHRLPPPGFTDHYGTGVTVAPPPLLRFDVPLMHPTICITLLCWVTPGAHKGRTTEDTISAHPTSTIAVLDTFSGVEPHNTTQANQDDS